jgi:hypothetical protein
MRLMDEERNSASGVRENKQPATARTRSWSSLLDASVSIIFPGNSSPRAGNPHHRHWSQKATSVRCSSLIGVSRELKTAINVVCQDHILF